MTDLPIACTLAPELVPGRRALIGGLKADGLLDQRPIAGGVRARFRDEPGVERRVRALVELESRCCAFLRFELDRADEAILVEITGSPDAQPMAEQFFS